MLRVLAAAAALASVTAIRNLVAPTSFTLDPNGRVWITEKIGRLRMAPSLAASSAAIVYDFTAGGELTSIGELGVTSVLYYQNFLYVTYQVGNASLAECPESGCPSHGRLSRFPLNVATGALGAEQIVLDSDLACVQYDRGGIAQVLQADPNGVSEDVLLTFGVGINNQVPADYGQIDGNPCGINATLPVGGAFRSQEPNSLDGKMIRFTPSTGAWSIVARGFNHPWRSTWAPANSTSSGVTRLLVGDAGAGDTEEINVVPAPAMASDLNFGFPCYSGSQQFTPYADLDTAVCDDLYADPASVTLPWAQYTRPSANNSVVVSAVAYWDGRVYWGDYMQNAIFSAPIDNATDVAVNATGGYPVYMQGVAGAGLYVVDVGMGTIELLNGEPPASAATGGAALALTALAAVLVAAAANLLA